MEEQEQEVTFKILLYASNVDRAIKKVRMRLDEAKTNLNEDVDVLRDIDEVFMERIIEVPRNITGVHLMFLRSRDAIREVIMECDAPGSTGGIEVFKWGEKTDTSTEEDEGHEVVFHSFVNKTPRVS
jgi:hypothetical protein